MNMKHKILIGILGLILISSTAVGYDIISFSGQIVPEIIDSDNDGVPDSDDLCPDSVGSVDSDGCSAKQFCNQYEIDYVRKGRKIHVDWNDYWNCVRADWQDNENVKYPKDCNVVKNRRTKEIYCTARRGAD